MLPSPTAAENFDKTVEGTSDEAAAARERLERRLLQAIVGGDREALAGLYRRHHPTLLRFLRRMGAQTDTGEEVINEVFWIVWQKAGDFAGAARVSTWLTGIAYRCLLKQLRQRPTTVPLPDDGAELSDDSDLAQRQEHRQWVSQGLAQLPTEQRSVLYLAYYLGYSLEEIAEITHCPISTVKARMFHARVKLRHVLPRLAGTDAADPRGALP